jgi:hypothetical protein
VDECKEPNQLLNIEESSRNAGGFTLALEFPTACGVLCQEHCGDWWGGWREPLPDGQVGGTTEPPVTLPKTWCPMLGTDSGPKGPAGSAPRQAFTTGQDNPPVGLLVSTPTSILPEMRGVTRNRAQVKAYFVIISAQLYL